MRATFLFEQRILLLGYLGFLPLVVASGWVMVDGANGLALEFFKNYAAVVLTFIGAIHWGRAMYNQNTSLVTLSVFPSLLACLCLMMPAVYALPLLASGFTLQLLLDTRQYQHIPHFKALRLQLSFLVVAILLVTWWYILL